MSRKVKYRILRISTNEAQGRQLEKDRFDLEELERVCASSEFANKPVMAELLAYLVTEYVEGRSDRIKGASIAADVFNRGSKVGQSLAIANDFSLIAALTLWCE